MDAGREAIFAQLTPGGWDFYGSYHTDTEQHKEWLLDAVWYQHGRHNMGLAAESEWAAGKWNRGKKLEQILYDFEKLMSVKAPLKLMVVESDDVCTRDIILKALVEYLVESDQNLRGERYLVVDFCSGRHYSYELEITSGPWNSDVLHFNAVKEATGEDIVVYSPV